MSGPICPECTTQALIESKENYSCPICGWSGANPPRKIMDHETSRNISERTRRLLQLRSNNQLRYVRIDLIDDPDQRSDAVFEIMSLMEPESTQGDSPFRFFVIGEKESIIKELQYIPGVLKVSVY